MSANEEADTFKPEFNDQDRTILILGLRQIGERLAPWRDESEEQGFPAHITILTPFFAEAELDDAIHADLREICAGIPSFDVNLVSVERVPGFIFLALESEREPRALLAALRERWPQFVPYDGLHGEDPTPHLTVAWPDTVDRHGRIATEVKTLLPLSERTTALTLLARRDHRWTTIAEFPLAA
jgi:2'-5' RNA ligase